MPSKSDIQFEEASGQEARPQPGTSAAATFDTSGCVNAAYGQHIRTPDRQMYLGLGWGALDAFTQGYIEALFADEDCLAFTGAGFRHLAPETLARIMEDCERRCDRKRTTFASNSECSGQGADFWSARQRGHVGGAPPLTPYLGDDGKVYLRASAQ